eukprot:CAMPEP_0172799252 /NCGR_PEP_ID=MMETSP1075-20121228/1765_1 /TAXON_ID=2916 /ORGANISM="Ceratium fusus, Strain PA161109" /LENGTH=159 /DNA_ID=CAMNT_0013636915 /DNA_START=89 /DNA_END=567 /DNA_ORIENTATION=+
MASGQPQARDVNFQEVRPQPPAASAPPPDAAQAFMPAQPRVLVGEPNQPLMVQQPVDNATCEKKASFAAFSFLSWVGSPSASAAQRLPALLGRSGRNMRAVQVSLALLWVLALGLRLLTVDVVVQLLKVKLEQDEHLVPLGVLHRRVQFGVEEFATCLL